MPPKYPKHLRQSPPNADISRSSELLGGSKSGGADYNRPLRGRLLFVPDVVTEVFQGRVSAWWVRRNVAPSQKLTLGHSTIAWYEDDVWTWIASRQHGAQQLIEMEHPGTRGMLRDLDSSEVSGAALRNGRTKGGK